ncbi:MAG TPA: hypothetical protein VGB83_02680 [Actinomycetota bacterium]
MSRVRISTTVDAELLDRARELVSEPDSMLVDRALGALVDSVEAEAERTALEAFPYEDDPDLAWTASEGPALPYEGKVPEAVLAKARARRRKK